MDVSNEASSEVQPSDAASFAVGDTFSSYDDLKKKLAEFEKSHSVQLTVIHRETHELSKLQLEESQRELRMLIQHWCIVPYVFPVCSGERSIITKEVERDPIKGILK